MDTGNRDEFGGAADALTYMLVKGYDPQHRDDITVERIPRSGAARLFLVELRGTAKEALSYALAHATGRNDARSGCVWVLDGREVAAVLATLQYLRDIPQP